MLIERLQLPNIKKWLAPNKVMVIYGPRRCGKTTLLHQLTSFIPEKYLFVSGEDIEVQRYLSSQSVEKLRSFIGDYRWLIVDEAQQVPDIGLNLKIMVDHIEGIHVIATGSSAFGLAQNIGEPLVGRKRTFKLYPLAQLELQKEKNYLEADRKIEERLIYGAYPEVVLAENLEQKKEILKDIVHSHLYKDILSVEGLRHSKKIINLLELIALQIGKEVSFSEIGNQLDMSKNTAERYLYLLEETFVLQRIQPILTLNKRKAIRKSPRYYFIDTGIRNAIIQNFNPLSIRADVGELWENFLIMERIKKQEYQTIRANNYFWRSYSQKEVDFVEEREGKYFGFEIKWGKSVPKAPSEWLEIKGADYTLVNKKNYLEFIC